MYPQEGNRCKIAVVSSLFTVPAQVSNTAYSIGGVQLIIGHYGTHADQLEWYKWHRK
jgi:hypothetical protein